MSHVTANLDQFSKAERIFMDANPGWKEEHKNELANVFKHLMDEGQITSKTKPARVALIIADFIS